MLRVVLAWVELEMVPEGLHGHAGVPAQARRRGKDSGATLLDSSLHHAAPKGSSPWHPPDLPGGREPQPRAWKMASELMVTYRRVNLPGRPG